MTPGQQTLLIAVDTLNEADFADLSFVTELTTRIQRRVFGARSSKMITKSPQTRIQPVVDRPNKITSTKLIQKLTPTPSPKLINAPYTLLRPAPKVADQFKITHDEKVSLWVQCNVSVGTIVKMKGTRDGHGYRLIKLFDLANNTLDCMRLVQINPTDLGKVSGEMVYVINDPEVPYLQYFRLTNFPTTHGMAKVVAVVSPRGGLNNSHLVTKLPAL